MGPVASLARSSSSGRVPSAAFFPSSVRVSIVTSSSRPIVAHLRLRSQPSPIFTCSRDRPSVRKRSSSGVLSVTMVSSRRSMRPFEAASRPSSVIRASSRVSSSSVTSPFCESQYPIRRAVVGSTPSISSGRAGPSVAARAARMSRSFGCSSTMITPLPGTRRCGHAPSPGSPGVRQGSAPRAPRRASCSHRT